MNLQKFTLWACDEPASMRMLAPAQKTRFLAERTSSDLDLRILKAKALKGVGEFDIDAEVVGIEL